MADMADSYVVDKAWAFLQGRDHVVPQEFKARVGQQVGDVLLPAGEQVVEADDLVAIADQPVAEVAAQKAGAAGDEDAHGERESENEEARLGEPSVARCFVPHPF